MAGSRQNGRLTESELHCKPWFKRVLSGHQCDLHDAKLWNYRKYRGISAPRDMRTPRYKHTLFCWFCPWLRCMHFVCTDDDQVIVCAFCMHANGPATVQGRVWNGGGRTKIGKLDVCVIAWHPSFMNMRRSTCVQPRIKSVQMLHSAVIVQMNKVLLLGCVEWRKTNRSYLATCEAFSKLRWEGTNKDDGHIFYTVWNKIVFAVLAAHCTLSSYVAPAKEQDIFWHDC